MKIRVQHVDAWGVDSHWILGSRTRFGNEPVFKFCYEPPTGKLWLGHGTQNHKTILNIKSGRVLEEVVRGIYFRERRLIYLRGHTNEAWLRQTAAMLEARGLPEDHRVVWGVKAAQRLRHLLEDL